GRWRWCGRGARCLGRPAAASGAGVAAAGGHPGRPGHRPAQRPRFRRGWAGRHRGDPSAVWVANSLDLSVTKIDTVTGRVTDTIPVGDGPHAIVAGPGGVWVSNEYGATLAHIDPGTGQVRKIFMG